MMTQSAKHRNPTHEDRAAAWRPETWHVDRESPQEFRLRNLVAPIEFHVWDGGDGSYGVRGHSGEVHPILLGCCRCKGKEQALRENRLCPHEAAVVAVERAKDGDADPFGGEYDTDVELTPEQEHELEETWGREEDEAQARLAREGERVAEEWEAGERARRASEALIEDLFVGCE